MQSRITQPSGQSYIKVQPDIAMHGVGMNRILCRSSLAPEKIEKGYDIVRLHWRVSQTYNSFSLSFHYNRIRI